MIVAAGFAVVLASHFYVQARWRKLRRIGCVTSWEEVVTGSMPVAEIVEINFGYGREIWVLLYPNDDIDLEHRTYKRGRVVLPRPGSRELQEFCKMRGVKFVRKQVKLASMPGNETQ